MRSTSGRPRRDLDPRLTAHFIASSDFVTIIVVSVTLHSVAHDIGYWHFPLCVMSTGVILETARFVLLLWLTGTWLILISKTALGAYRLVNDLLKGLFEKVEKWPDPKFLSTWSSSTRPSTQRIKQPGFTGVWYVLIGMGIVAQMLIVAGSGGIVGSPFTGVLVATFVFGQFRSPTRTVIGTLAGTGLVVCTVAQLIYSWLHGRYLKQFEMIHYADLARVVPLLLIAVMSTIVTLVNFEAEPLTSSGAQPSTPTGGNK